jgi:hypothetical protein
VDCQRIIGSTLGGCDGRVRWVQEQGDRSQGNVGAPVQQQQRQQSVRVRQICRRSCQACCEDVWAVETEKPNFCADLIASGCAKWAGRTVSLLSPFS